MNSKEALDKLFMACDNDLLYEQSGIMFAIKLTSIIEKDLDRLEKLEKVVEILKSMGIRLEHYPKSKNHPYVLKIQAFGDDLFFDLVNELRYNLLKEVLGNE